jgi:F0F1-type ATP synthase delta subunit
MTSPSRRLLARYGASQLVAKRPVAEIARELGSVLIASRRQKEADLLVSDIAWELERRGQAANTKLTSAFPLTQSLKQEIQSFVKKAAKVDSVILDEQIDKKVLGGVRIETARHAWDKTLARALADIRKEF